jgi:hypothetical protein
MMILNRILATIISLLLIVGAVTGSIYLVGLLAGSNSITQPIARTFNFVAGLSFAQVIAVLTGAFVVSLTLFILEVRPWRSKFITISESDSGTTKVFKSDVESYLADRLAREQRTVTPTSVDVIVLDDYRFNVDTSVAVSTTADRDAVKEQVGNTIKNDLAVIGLGKELGRVSSQVARVKRAA